MSIYQSVCLHTSAYLTVLHICLPIYLSVYLSTYLCAHLSVYLLFYLYFYLSIYLSIHLSIYLSTYLFLNPCIYPSNSLFVLYLGYHLWMCKLIWKNIRTTLCTHRFACAGVGLRLVADRPVLTCSLFSTRIQSSLPMPANVSVHVFKVYVRICNFNCILFPHTHVSMIKRHMNRQFLKFIFRVGHQ